MVGLTRLAARLGRNEERAGRRGRPSRRFDHLESRRLMAAGTAPTDLAQYMLELINRARANPAAEGQRLLALAQSDPLIHQATANWDLAAFARVISSYAPSPPLAFNPRLIDAALAESGAMLAQNAQRHSPPGFLNDPGVATASDGQPYYSTPGPGWATGENIFAYSQYVNAAASPTAYADYFEAGFLLDWGNPDFGHLRNILAPGPSQANTAAGVYPFSEVGIGLITNATPATPAAINVGPALVTQEFGWRQGNAFLTGTFYVDALNRGFYAPGEGYGNVTIRAQGLGGQGTYQTQTWSSGGYSLQLPPGKYAVTASGPLPGVQTTTITIGQDNVGWSMAFAPGQAADIPVPADYDGVGRAEVATYRPSNGLWMISNPNGGFRSALFGLPGDIPVPGHYDGGRAEIAVYRPSTATWYIIGPNGPYSVQFGAPGDIPVPGDYDADGRTDLAVYRPSTATWFIWKSGSQAMQVTQWGIPYLDQPIPAAYDGGGRAEIAVIRPTTYQWFILTSGGGYRVVQHGGPGMVPVPADYDGVGRAEIAVFQPSTGTWYIRNTGRIVSYGNAGSDQAAPADYNGDGRADIAVYRPATSEWFVQGNGGAAQYNQFGQGGTGQALRTLAALSLGTPAFWVDGVAAPGANHAAAPAPATTPTTTSGILARPAATVAPAPTSGVATPAGPSPRRRQHAAKGRPASPRAIPAYRARSSSAKKA